MSDDVLAIRFLSEASTNWLCQQTVLMIHWSWQSDLTLVRSTDWALFWSVVIFRMICQSRDQWLVTADGEKCKCPPAGMVIHHWFMLVKNCQIDHVAEVVMCCFVLFAVLMAVMWIMFPEGQPTKIAECCQLSLDSDRLRLEHNLPAVCLVTVTLVVLQSHQCQVRSMSAVHQQAQTQPVYCWMFWVMFDCIHSGSNLSIAAVCFCLSSFLSSTVNSMTSSLFWILALLFLFYLFAHLFQWGHVLYSGQVLSSAVCIKSLNVESVDSLTVRFNCSDFICLCFCLAWFIVLV